MNPPPGLGGQLAGMARCVGRDPAPWEFGAWIHPGHGLAVRGIATGALPTLLSRPGGFIPRSQSFTGRA